MLNFTDMMQIAVLGFFTGLGTTMGGELAKVLIKKLNYKKENEWEGGGCLGLRERLGIGGPKVGLDQQTNTVKYVLIVAGP